MAPFSRERASWVAFQQVGSQHDELKTIWTVDLYVRGAVATEYAKLGGLEVGEKIRAVLLAQHRVRAGGRGATGHGDVGRQNLSESLHFSHRVLQFVWTRIASSYTRQSRRVNLGPTAPRVDKGEAERDESEEVSRVYAHGMSLTYGGDHRADLYGLYDVERERKGKGPHEEEFHNGMLAGLIRPVMHQIDEGQGV